MHFKYNQNVLLTKIVSPSQPLKAFLPTYEGYFSKLVKIVTLTFQSGHVFQDIQK